MKDTSLKIVHGARRSAYGHPMINFGRISDFWTTWLKDKLKRGARISRADVSALNVLQKMARLMQSYKPDSTRDVRGYSLTWDITARCERARARRAARRAK